MTDKYDELDALDQVNMQLIAELAKLRAAHDFECKDHIKTLGVLRMMSNRAK